MSNNRIIFRWSIGDQNTISLSGYNKKTFDDFLLLAKTSILSFQKWFKGANFYILYNGNDFESFKKKFNNSIPALIEDVIFVNQNNFQNPYNFQPCGVWWKWIPWRIDIDFHEIAVDTDIICLSEPLSWYKWFETDSQILVAPERFEKTNENTCGNFGSNFFLENKTPYNCGVVGQKAGFDFGQEFFKITDTIKIGESESSIFIDEQGAINYWINILKNNNIDCYVLDFHKNAWIRDFIYFLKHDIKVETVHAVTWYKRVVIGLNELFIRKINDDTYSDIDFCNDIIVNSVKLDKITQYVLLKQMYDNNFSKEILIRQK